MQKYIDKISHSNLSSGHLLNTGNPATAPVSIAAFLRPASKGVLGWTGNISNTCRSWLRCVQHPSTCAESLEQELTMSQTTALALRAAVPSHTRTSPFKSLFYLVHGPGAADRATLMQINCYHCGTYLNLHLHHVDAPRNDLRAWEHFYCPGCGQKSSMPPETDKFYSTKITQTIPTGENTMNPLVIITGQKAITTSLIIAEVFEKQHKNVMQSIERLECSAEFRRLNFQPSSYLNEQNKPQPMYQITKDAFIFLAMGFTGSKAAQFKEAFIAQFNAMEKMLLEGSGKADKTIDVNMRHKRGVTNKQGMDMKYTLDLTKIFMEPNAFNLTMLQRVSGLDLDDMIDEVTTVRQTPAPMPKSR